MEKLKVKESNLRVDKYLSQELNLPRNQIADLIKNKKVFINAVVAKCSDKLKANDVITYTKVKDKNIIQLNPENIPLDIIFENEDYLVINKQANLVIHPSQSTKSHTLVNALLNHTSNLSTFNKDNLRPGIVHRLDKNTTGLLVVAKQNKAHEFLYKQLKTKKLNREYIAIVHNRLASDTGVIDKPITRDKNNRLRMKAGLDGRSAKTFYTVIKRYTDYTLVNFKLETGRTHQIRVHSKYINHPIVGDNTYSKTKSKIKANRPMLHSHKIEFISPTTNQLVSYKCDIPEDMLQFINKLEGNKNELYWYYEK